MPDPLKISYKDYVIDQMAQSRNSSILEYWREELFDYRKYSFPEQPDINNGNSVANSTVTPLSSELYNQLKDSARNQRVTVKSLCLSAFVTTLYMLSYEDDILIGVVENGRPVHEDGARILGCFLNTVPMRTQFESLVHWGDITQDVYRKQAALKKYGRLSLVQILNAIGEQSSRENPLFDIAFNYIDFHVYESVEKGMFEFKSYSYEKTNTMLDFSISVTLGELSVKMVSSYPKEFTDRLLDIYLRVLGCLIAKPEQEMNTADIITAEEHALLATYNDTTAEYPYEANIVELFEQQVVQRSERTAVVMGDEQLSYREFGERVDQLAIHLVESGVAPGQHVGLISRRSIDMITAIFAILKAGCTYIPLDPEFPNERIRTILADSEVSVLVAEKDLFVSGYEGKQISLSKQGQLLSDSERKQASEMLTNCRRSAEDVAYIMYTSGSTGKPKGVQTTHRNIVKTVINNGFVDINETDRMLQLSNYAFDGSTYEIFGALLNGATLVLIPKDAVLNVSELADTLEHERITSAFMTAVLFNAVVEWDVQSLKHVRRLFFGGETGSKKHVEKALQFLGNDRIANGYGPTETTVFAATYLVNQRMLDYNTVPIGKPVHNTQAHVMNRRGQLQPLGVPGELYISGDGLAEGYLNQTELTGERFVIGAAGERMYRTGDLVRWLADGNLEYMGRLDQQVKIRGNRIELGEIESRLSKVESIQDAVVVTEKDEQGHAYLCAYIVPSDTKKPVLDWKKELRQTLPEYMVPSTFVTLEAFPMTLNGKLDRKALPKPTRRQSNHFVAPSNVFEDKLARIWEEILDIQSVGVEEHFFEIGGHSLKAMMLVARVQKETGVKVSLQDVFVMPTIREMALWIMTARSTDQSGEEIVPASYRDTYPASSIQQRMYIVQQMENADVSYNMPFVVRLDGKLDLDAMEKSMQMLIQRHEVLRTSFELHHGKLQQRIHRPDEMSIAPLHLEEASLTDTEDSAIQVFMDQFIKPFDLGKAPLFRRGLLRINEKRHILLLDMHHIISDARSMEIIISEWARLYQGQLLPDLHVQYKDYAVWEQEVYLQRDAYNRSNEYWMSLYRDEVPVIELPTDHLRSPIRSYKGSRMTVGLEPDLVTRLKHTALTNKQTLFMLMMASYQILLSKYSAAEDIVVGTPFTCRDTLEHEHMVGMFANTLALRSRPKAELSVSAYLEMMRELTLSAYQHGQYPLEDLIDRLSLPFDSSQHPLFGTMFMVQESATAALHIPGLEVQYTEWDHHASKFDMTWVCTHSEDDMTLSVEYRTDLWEPHTVNRMLQHYVHLLQQIVTFPELKIGELELVTESEIAQLEQWNNRDADYPQDVSIAELFEQQVRLSSEKPAVRMEGHLVTYQELNERVNRLAGFLITQGVQQGQRVGLIMDRSIEVIVAMLAIVKSGGAYVPIDPSFPADRKSFMLTDSGARWLIADHPDQVPDYEGEVVIFDENCWAHESIQNPVFIQNSAGSAYCGPPGPEDSLYVMYTSGSTGTPKGVITTHRNVIKTVIHNGYVDISHEDRLLQISNYAFDGSTFDIYGALLHGAELVLMKREEVLDGSALGRVIREQRITIAFMTTALFNTLVDLDPACLTGTSKILFGGEKVSGKHVKKAVGLLGKHRLVHVYGPTETTVFATFYSIASGEYIPIGQPTNNTRLYVLDREGKRLPVGIPGELYIGGQGLAQGYLGQPKLTHDKFIANPFIPGERLYRTGDLVKWLPDGNLEFIDRIDHQVKIRGNRIELGEVEGQLRMLPGIHEAIVMADRDEQGHSYLCAYIILQDGEPKQSFQELASMWKQELKHRLPEYMIPTVFSFLDAIPLTHNGKIDRKKLPKPVLVRGQKYVPAENSVQQGLVGIWESVLGITKIGILDHFFELGGHSLKAMLLVGKIHQEFDVRLTLLDVFQTPVLRDMAEWIQQATRNLYAAIKPAPDIQSYPVTSVQKQIYYAQQYEYSGTSYNMPMLFEISGALDKDRLEACFKRVIARHESLRTSFDMVNSELIQRIHTIDEVEWKLERWDMDSLQSSIQESDSSEADPIHLLMSTFVRPFDLAHAPLIRAVVIETDRERHLLALDTHHIVSDGVSTHLIYDELFDLYEVRPLSPIRVQFKDYVMWKLKQQESSAYEETQQFWMDQYSQFESSAELPMDRARPAIRSYRGASYTFGLPSKRVQELKRAAAGYGATPFILLLSTYGLMLSKYTGEEEITVGAPVAGREHVDIEPTVGMFVNTLPLKLNPAANLSIGEYIHHVKNYMLAVHERGMYSLSDLLDKLHYTFQPNRNPLFDTLFVLQDMTLPVKTLQDMSVRKLDWHGQQAKFDMSWVWHEDGDELVAEVEYSPDLWDRVTIEQMTRHYVHLLEQLLNSRDTKLRELELLTLQEKYYFKELNKTDAPYPRDWTVIDAFEASVSEQPAQEALLYGTETVTYGQLNERVNRMTALLKRRGIRSGDYVGLLTDRKPEMIVAILAILKAGGTYVPLDPNFPEERLVYILRDSGAQWLIIEQDRTLHSYTGTIIPLLEPQVYAEGSTTQAPISYSAEQPVYVMYTSGSTGMPKGVVTSHRNVVKTCINNGFVEIDQQDRMLQLSNYAFDGATYEIFGALLNGATLVLMPNHHAYDVSFLTHILRQERITSLFMTTSLFNTVVDYDVNSLQGMRKLFIGGEAASVKHVIKALDVLGEHRIVNGYGPTETTVFAATYSVDEKVRESGRVPIGRSIHNTRLYVLNTWGKPQPVGVPGELYIGGEGLAAGYLGQPELTEERFLTRHIDGEERVYRTGDLVRWLTDGTLEYLGRLDQQVKIRGNRIGLTEIEDHILALPEVNETVVIAQRDDQGHSMLAAYVVLDHAGALTGEEAKDKHLVENWRKTLKETLPEYMVPSVFIQLSSLPLTRNGKLDRKALPKPDLASLSSDYVAPSTHTEKELAQLWADVLGLAQAGVHDHFFEMGGHSLKAMVLIAKVQEQWAIKLSMPDLFDAPTLKQMASLIDEGDKQNHTVIPRAQEQEDYPVSSAQKRLYLVEQFEDTGTSYNMPVVLRMKGRPDMIRLELALKGLIRRHESLRTSFKMVEGELRQHIHAMEDMNWKLEHGSEPDMLDSHMREEQTAQYISTFVRPFDLGCAPLMRAGLCALSDREYLLIMDMHHIVSDGVTTGILYQDFIRLYQGQPLDAMPVQYKDYAVWMSEQKSRLAYQASEDYWLKRYEKDITVLDILTEGRRPSRRQFEGSSHTFELSPELSGAVRKLAQQTDATLFMVMLAAYNILLSKYTGEQDIIVGIPFAGRTHTDISSVAGMFVNTLALRQELHGDLRIHEWIGHVRRETLLAYEHGEYPLDELIEKLQVARDPERNPLFDTMFVLQDAKPQMAELQDLHIEPLDWASNTSKFDMTWVVHETQETLKLTVEYATDLYERSQMERMAVHYEHVLSQMSATPDMLMNEIRLITPSEEHEILGQFNDTYAEYPRDRTISQLFETQASLRPDHTALQCYGETLTYQELNEKVCQLASYLAQSGLQRGDAVGLLADRSIEMIVSILGILRAGGVYVPLDPSYPHERMTYMLEHCHASMLIAPSDRPLAGFKGVIVPLEESRRIPLDQNALSAQSNRSQTILPDEATMPAYIMYTSGSTGLPKGVVTTHRNVIKTSINNGFIRIREQDRMLQLSNYAFDGSTYEIFGSLLNGATLVLISREDLLDINKLSSIMKGQRITSAFVTSVLFNALVDHDVTCLQHVHRLFVGGEALSKSHVMQAQQYLGDDRIANGYGPTETTVFATTYNVGRSLAGLGSVPIGRPIHNSRTYILDAQGHLLPVGVAGELYIAGDGVAEKYVGDSDLTLARFLDDPFCPGERMYRTGDRVRWMPDGSIEFLARMDHQVKIRGHRIEPGEIEARMIQHPDVQEAVVIPRQDNSGHYLCAYIVSSGGFHEQELRKYVQQSLPEYMVPSYFVAITKLPVTRNGKLDRGALPAPDLDSVKGDYSVPVTQKEQILALVWSEVLGVDRVGIDDNYFVLGGDSIKSIQIASRLTRHQFKLQVKHLMLHPTIAECAEFLEPMETRKEQQDLIEGDIPLTPIQQWFFAQDYSNTGHWNQSMMLYNQEGWDTDTVNQVFRKLSEHHDALRIRFEIRPEGVVQTVFPIDTEKLFPMEEHEVEADWEPVHIERLATAIQSQMNLEHDLIRLGVFRTPQGDHLLIAVHHLIIDGVSWRILLEDFHRMYPAILLGDHTVRLPEKTDSYAFWSRELMNYATSEEMKQQQVYWHELNQKALQLREHHDKPGLLKQSKTVTLELEASRTRELLTEVHCAYHTEVMDILLTALSMTYAKDIVIDLEGHGREGMLDHVDTTRTVGWFTSIYPVLLRTTHEEIGEALRHTKEMLRSIPGKGTGYSILKYLTSELKSEEVTCDPDIVFNYLGQFGEDTQAESFTMSPMPMGELISPFNRMSHFEEWNCVVDQGKFQLILRYDPSRMDEKAAMEQVASYGLNLERLIVHCLTREAEEFTPSDFSDADLTLDELDDISDIIAKL
ncbi:amino acid adenylation domain-containing protein [Paenibacillus xylanilyticus]|uniref:amino acid adenylation domain-containing protein n=1 Tax=Paenibacillus xylanilyticus TaxID=248903 RepID=UPI0039A07E63